MDIRIITDDFTSAIDGLAGFVFLEGGARALLDWHATDVQHAVAPSQRAVSVNTASRMCAPDEAARRVSVWAARWAKADVLVKQFDSTLRGPIAAECLAVWRASRRRKLLVVPAFPAAGRTSRGGRVLLNEVPVHESAFADDPLTPVRESSLVQLFEAEGRTLRVAADRADARSAFADGTPAVIVDAESEQDLLEIARTFVHDRDICWAGSTGIARALASVLKDEMGDRSLATQSVVDARGVPWVFVGSRHPVSRDQAHQLANDRPLVPILRMPDRRMASDDALNELRELAALAATAVKSGTCNGIVAAGGETAHALATALNATQMDVLRELEPGIPLGLLHGEGLTLALITKAGGFGHRQSLHRCIDQLIGAES